jgi:hypothetical protein
MVVREFDPLDELNRMASDALVLHPGDTLVVRVDPHTSAEFAAQLKEQGRQLLPNEVNLVIVAAEQLLVCRPGEEVQEGSDG